MSKNILNLAITDEGGAGKASLYLNEMLLKAGHNSVLIVKKSREKNKNVIVLSNPIDSKNLNFGQKVINRVRKVVQTDLSKQFDQKYNFLNINETKVYVSAEDILRRITFKPEVIIFHWVSKFVNTKTISKLGKMTDAKLFWLMMDNAPLTGGCHYPFDCLGYQSDCSNCPAILKKSMKVLAKNNLEFKRHHLPEHISLIAASEFDQNRAISSSLFKNKKIYKFLLPVDQNKYVVGDNTKARNSFRITKNKKVIFYGSKSNNNPRKGLRYFLDAISILERNIEQKGINYQDYLILIAGESKKDIFSHIRIPIVFTGYLTENKLIEAYQASNVFLNTSVQDSGPLMINQSIMCGTPVVSFKMGVALDLVITGYTGYLAILGDAEDLANGIDYILELDDQEYNKIITNCRNIGLKLCHPQQQAAKLGKFLGEDKT